MLSKVFVHSPAELCLECPYSPVHEEILKSLHRLQLSDSDLSTGLSYPAFEQLGPVLYCNFHHRQTFENWCSIDSNLYECIQYVRLQTRPQPKTLTSKKSLPFLSSCERLTCFRVTKRKQKFVVQGSSKMVLTQLLRYHGEDFADETRWMSIERKRENSRLVKAPGRHHKP